MSRVPDILQPAYRQVRRSLSSIDRAIDKRVLDITEFRDLMQRSGFTTGAVVMVHSSMDEVARRVPSMTPVSLVHLMMELVGPSGTIVMPAFPFRGKQLHYVESHTTFDRKRTPSQVGLITEVFRRLAGVIRSLHPTHSVAAWGRLAHALTATHHLGETFGVTSPIYKLREYDGAVVGLGTGLRDSFTILHVPEEIHETARARFFENGKRKMTIIDGTNQFDYTFRVLRTGVDRAYQRVERALLKDGTVNYIVSKGLKCAVTDADAFITRSMQLIDEGKYL